MHKHKFGSPLDSCKLFTWSTPTSTWYYNRELGEYQSALVLTTENLDEGLVLQVTAQMEVAAPNFQGEVQWLQKQP
jgi:hypothetical protein